MVTITDIKNNGIAPFECKDDKLEELFSYFLHHSPCIDSLLSRIVEDKQLNLMFNTFITEWDDKGLKYKIYSQNSDFPNENVLRDNYNLSEISIVSRNSKAFICFRKHSKEMDIVALLRSIRNAIAHGRVYLYNKSNRKYILFENFNKYGNKRAMILFTQTDLQKLRKITKT